jgi:hypothetical protein
MNRQVVTVVAKVGVFLLGAFFVGQVMANHRDLWFIGIPVWAVMFLALRSAAFNVMDAGRDKVKAEPEGLIRPIARPAADVIIWEESSFRVAESRSTTAPSTTWTSDPGGAHTYTSTACIHARHDQCRLTCKFCQARCLCTCHASDSTFPARKVQDESDPE